MKVAQFAYLPLKFIFALFKPVIFLFHKITILFNSLIGVQDEKRYLIQKRN